MRQKKFYDDIVSIDQNNQICIDKVERISLVHGTGHITVITKNGKEFNTRRDDLITELRTDQHPAIINRRYTLFEDFIKIQYIDKRTEEFNKIIKGAKLKIIRTDEVKLNKTWLDVFEVIVKLHHTIVDLSISK